MLPRAEIVHQSPGRLRLLVPERRRDRGYFARVEKELSETGMVRVNPVCGSVRVLHATDPSHLARRAEERGLFLIDESKPAGREPWVERIRIRAERMEAGLKDSTSGEYDIRSVAVGSLIGLSLYQVARGRNFLPAGGSLLWYAIGLISK